VRCTNFIDILYFDIYLVSDNEIMSETNPHDKARLIAMKRNYDYMAAMFAQSDPADVSEIVAVAAHSTKSSGRETAESTEASESESDDSTESSESESDDSMDESASKRTEASCQSDGGDYYEYEPVNSFADALNLPSSSGHAIEALCTPKEEYWDFIDRTFIDIEDDERFIVIGVVRSNEDVYFFQYATIDSEGKQGEEHYSTCHEMMADNSWARWGAFKKKKVWYHADAKKVSFVESNE
jgi:hypothetical protein